MDTDKKEIQQDNERVGQDEPKVEQQQDERNIDATAPRKTCTDSLLDEVSQEFGLGGNEEEEIATAEDMAAFIEGHKAKKQKSDKMAEQEKDVFGEYCATENSIDPYQEPDPTLPWTKYEDNVFLSRGCKECPQSYHPISTIETNRCAKMTACDWLKGIRQPSELPFEIVEVRFKNNRKDFYRIPEGISVTEGDVVAVEGLSGHDIGIVSMTGELCRLQMKKHRIDPTSDEIKRLFRRAKPADIEHWKEAISEEKEALPRARKIASDLGLEMKINDIEFQGDHSKAIFYYTADDRVDFRTLIKVLAEEFKVRIEMKQIGIRQEAGKVGGIGTCGRELCCSTWMSNFKSVTTNAAKTQQILPNPQKLAGQCGKLKCCLNFEYEVYADALKNFPATNTPIRFKKGLALYRKTDVLRGIMWYCYEGENDLHAITAEDVKKVIEMNNRQEYPEQIEDYQVELMGTSTLNEEASTTEFEQELRRMADNGNETASEKGRERRGGRQERETRDNDRKPRRDNDRHQRANGGQRRNDTNNNDEKPREERNQEERKGNRREERKEEGRKDERREERKEVGRKEERREDRKEERREDRKEEGRKEERKEERREERRGDKRGDERRREDSRRRESRRHHDKGE